MQADRERHDLIFDVVEDIAKILGCVETHYLKNDYHDLRESLDRIVALGDQFVFGHLWRIEQDVKLCVDWDILWLYRPPCSGFIALLNTTFVGFETVESFRDWLLQFYVSLATVSQTHSDRETHG